MKNNWTPQPYKIEDLPKVALFFKKQYQGFGDYGTLGLFHWKLEQNSSLKGLLNIIKDNETIASTTSVVPKKAMIQGKNTLVGEIGDTYTDSNYQRQGMFSTLINQTREDAVNTGIKIVYGTPNANSLPGYEKKANFKQIKSLKLKQFSFITNAESFFSRKVHWLLAKKLGLFSAFSFYLLFKIKSFFASNQGISIKEVNELPDNWNDFISKSSESFDFIISRDAESLNWRYFNNPSKYNFLLIKKDQNIVGYIVYRKISQPNDTKIFVADYLTLPGEESSLKVAIKHVLLDGFKSYCSSISLWCSESSRFFDTFKKNSFTLKKMTSVPVITYQNEEGISLESISKWHFTIGDSDNV